MDIATRFVDLFRANLTGKERDEEIAQIETSIRVCHLNGTPLRLQELLVASPSDLAHDVGQIHRNVSRTTGKLEGWFLPRYYDAAATSARRSRHDPAKQAQPRPL